MIRKYIPYLLIFLSLIVLLIMMTAINEKKISGQSIMDPAIITEAVAAIILLTVGISMAMKDHK